MADLQPLIREVEKLESQEEVPIKYDYIDYDYDLAKSEWERNVIFFLGEIRRALTRDLKGRHLAD